MSERRWWKGTTKLSPRVGEELDLLVQQASRILVFLEQADRPGAPVGEVRMHLLRAIDLSTDLSSGISRLLYPS